MSCNRFFVQNKTKINKLIIGTFDNNRNIWQQLFSELLTTMEHLIELFYTFTQLMIKIFVFFIQNGDSVISLDEFQFTAGLIRNVPECLWFVTSDHKTGILDSDSTKTQHTYGAFNQNSAIYLNFFFFTNSFHFALGCLDIAKIFFLFSKFYFKMISVSLSDTISHIKKKKIFLLKFWFLRVAITPTVSYSHQRMENNVFMRI